MAALLTKPDQPNYRVGCLLLRLCCVSPSGLSQASLLNQPNSMRYSPPFGDVLLLIYLTTTSVHRSV